MKDFLITQTGESDINEGYAHYDITPTGRQPDAYTKQIKLTWEPNEKPALTLVPEGKSADRIKLAEAIQENLGAEFKSTLRGSSDRKWVRIEDTDHTVLIKAISTLAKGDNKLLPEEVHADILNMELARLGGAQKSGLMTLEETTYGKAVSFDPSLSLQNIIGIREEAGSQVRVMSDNLEGQNKILNVLKAIDSKAHAVSKPVEKAFDVISNMTIHEAAETLGKSGLLPLSVIEEMRAESFVGKLAKEVVASGSSVWRK